MRILNLYSENIKKIKAIDITPDGDTVVIGGKNGNGKSSTLDSIAMVLGGKKLIPTKPIREGEETAKISVDLGDYKVTRNWTNPTTSYLKLQNKDGANITNAQGILNRIIGDLSFDPLEFSTMDPAKRFDILRKLTKVDFTDLNQEYGDVYDQRTEVGREGKALNVRLETEFKDMPNFADKVDDIENIKKQRAEAQDHNDSVDTESRRRENLEDEVTSRRQRVINQKTTVDDLKQQLEDEALLLTMEEQKLEAAERDLAEHKELTFDKQDLSQFDEKIEKFYQWQKAKDAQDRKAKVEQERDDARAQWDILDNRLKEIDKAKSDMIANADMPIDGLSFGDKEILFNGIPFVQLSMSEQIQVSISIAIAMNPRLRVAMIYNGSLLDEDAMGEIAKVAAAKDVQIWIERVADKPDGNCIFIENGEVKGEQDSRDQGTH